MEREQLEIVLGQLLHEALVGLDLAHELAEHLQAVAQLDPLVVDQVRQDEGRAPALTLDRVNKDATAAVQALVDKPVRDPEVLLGILLWLIVDLQVEVFEVSISLGVSLARHIQNVCHSCFDQFARFESALEGPHIDAIVDLKQTDVSDCFLAVHIARAKVNVRETATSDTFFVAFVGHSAVLLASPSLLLIDGRSTESGIPLHCLQLRD